MTDIVDRLWSCAQGLSLGADGVGWSPDPRLIKEAAEKIELLRKRLDVALYERDVARQKMEHYIAILVGIHALTDPPPVTAQDGKVYVFNNPNAAETLRELSKRIRDIPDRLEQLRAGEVT